MEEDVFDPVSPQQREGSWIDRPGIRSALLQAGLQMLMPTAPGTSIGGNIASAIGSGGEAYRRAVGTNIAGRKQKESEVETESQTQYRDALTGKAGGKSGGMTLSQRMSAQKAAKKEWGDFLKGEAGTLVDSGQFTDENAALDFLTNDQNKANTIAKFKKGQALAQEATGQQTLRTVGDLQAAGPELFAQLKQMLLAGDPTGEAAQALAILRARVADPESLDALLGAPSGQP